MDRARELLHESVYCPVWRKGELYYSAADVAPLAAGWEFDGCIWLHDNARRVQFERVQFVRAADRWVALVDGEPIKNAELIVCGQRLVERGNPIDPGKHANSRWTVSYVDKRHLLRNPYSKLRDRTTRQIALDENGKPIKRDFGLDQILADPERLRGAIEGAIVQLDLKLRDVNEISYDVDPADLTHALHDKSYQPCATLEELEERQAAGERGSYHLDVSARVCCLIYHRSPYPVHFLAARENGDTVLIDGVVGGFSNNAGCTVSGLANDLQSSGFTEALLLDNGGDTAFVYRDSTPSSSWPDPNGSCALIPSSLRRTQWAALMLYQGDAKRYISVGYDDLGSGGVFSVEWNYA